MKQDLEIIRDLMDELVNDMEPKEEDFSERLGRSKPKIAAIKMEVEGESGDSVSEDEKDRLGAEDDLEDPSVFEMGFDPGERLKNRIKKLRG